MVNLLKQRSGLFAAAALLAAALGLAPAQSEAALILKLDDGVNSVTITDGQPGDANTFPGEVLFFGPFGSWTTNIAAGVGNEVLGTPGEAQIDLISVNVSGGSGSLTISLTQTDISAPLGQLPFVIGIGGTTQGTVAYEAYADAGNAEFGEGIALGALGPYGGLGFGGEAYGEVTLLSDYSLTQVVTITHSEAGLISSFDATIKVPEPASIALLGFGLLLLGAMVRRRAAPLA